MMALSPSESPKGSIYCPLKDSGSKDVTIPSVVFGTRVLKWAVHGPFGSGIWTLWVIQVHREVYVSTERRPPSAP